MSLFVSLYPCIFMENLIQNSGDVLNLVIAAAVALFVLFVCWGLFYMVMVFRNISKITKDTRKGFSRISEILDHVKEQVESGTFYFSLISDGLKKGVEFLRKKTEGGGKSKKANKDQNKKNNTKSAVKNRTSKTSSAKKTSKKVPSLWSRKKSKKS